jgi:hypothetical protein
LQEPPRLAKLARTADRQLLVRGSDRRYRTIEIQAGAHTITAADPIPDDLHDALNAINHGGRAY